MTDIVAMARAAQADERLSDGALYGKLADEIERLRAEVAALRANAPFDAVEDYQQFRRDNPDFVTVDETTTGPRWKR